MQLINAQAVISDYGAQALNIASMDFVLAQSSLCYGMGLSVMMMVNDIGVFSSCH